MFRRLGRLAAARPPRTLALLALAALLARLAVLGARPMHWDEARVGYWTLRYLETGTYSYRPIIHGPFLPVVLAPVFRSLGPTAFAARLPAALLGGLFPLAALLFWDPRTANASESPRRAWGLDGAETVALGLVLAVDPVLVYYSRFMRADLPLAVFAFTAFGLAVRAVGTGRRRALALAGLPLGLALTTKENALVYLACFGGAGLVALAVPAVGAWRAGDATPRGATWATVGRLACHLRRHLPAVPAALALALPPVIWFYAPRGAAGDPPLAAALADPGRWPAVARQATLGSWETFVGSLWLAPHGNSYGLLLAFFAGVVLTTALPVVLAAGVGGLAERRGAPPRPLVLACVAWGLASLLGYPLAADIPAPWLAVHLVVPLTVPAAVGLVALARTRNRWADAGRPAGTALTAVVLLVALQAGGVVAATSYLTPAGPHPLAQAGQPVDDMAPLAADLAAAADEGGVLYYGDALYLPNESVADTPPAPGTVWLGWWVSRLPMPWYTERVDAPTAYARFPDDVRARTTIPPVVIAKHAEADEVAPLLAGYDRTVYDTKVYGDGRFVVFVDRERVSRREASRERPPIRDPVPALAVRTPYTRGPATLRG